MIIQPVIIGLMNFMKGPNTVKKLKAIFLKLNLVTIPLTLFVSSCAKLQKEDNEQENTKEKSSSVITSPTLPVLNVQLQLKTEQENKLNNYGKRNNKILKTSENKRLFDSINKGYKLAYSPYSKVIIFWDKDEEIEYADIDYDHNTIIKAEDLDDDYMIVNHLNPSLDGEPNYLLNYQINNNNLILNYKLATKKDDKYYYSSNFFSQTLVITKPKEDKNEDQSHNELLEKTTNSSEDKKNKSSDQKKDNNSEDDQKTFNSKQDKLNDQDKEKSKNEPVNKNTTTEDNKTEEFKSNNQNIDSSKNEDDLDKNTDTNQLENSEAKQTTEESKNQESDAQNQAILILNNTDQNFGKIFDDMLNVYKSKNSNKTKYETGKIVTMQWYVLTTKRPKPFLSISGSGGKNAIFYINDGFDPNWKKDQKFDSSYDEGSRTLNITYTISGNTYRQKFIVPEPIPIEQMQENQEKNTIEDNAKTNKNPSNNESEPTSNKEEKDSLDPNQKQNTNKNSTDTYELGASKQNNESLSQEDSNTKTNSQNTMEKSNPDQTSNTDARQPDNSNSSEINSNQQGDKNQNPSETTNTDDTNSQSNQDNNQTQNLTNDTVSENSKNSNENQINEEENEQKNRQEGGLLVLSTEENFGKIFDDMLEKYKTNKTYKNKWESKKELTLKWYKKTKSRPTPFLSLASSKGKNAVFYIKDSQDPSWKDNKTIKSTYDESSRTLTITYDIKGSTYTQFVIIPNVTN